MPTKSQQLKPSPRDTTPIEQLTDHSYRPQHWNHTLMLMMMMTATQVMISDDEHKPAIYTTLDVLKHATCLAKCTR